MKGKVIEMKKHSALEPTTSDWQRTVFLHDAQELDNDFGAGTDEDLALAGFFRIIDGVERIVENTCFDHV